MPLSASGIRRRAAAAADRVHDAAVSASANVPVRIKKRAQQLAHALESFENLPEYLRDNEFIHGFYRQEQSLRSSLSTLFKLHNETGNVWSHLIGFLLFLALARFFVTHPPTPLAVGAHHLDHVWQAAQQRLAGLAGSLLQPAAGGAASTSSSSASSSGGLLLGDNLQALTAAVSGRAAALEGALADNLHQVSAALASGVTSLSAAVTGNLATLQGGVRGLGSSAADAVQAVLQQARPGLSHTAEAAQQYIATLTQQHLGALLQWPVPRWPVYVYFAGAMVCLLTSCVCHLLGCCRRHISELVWRFDYAGIAVLIMASFVPAVYYAFMCAPFWRHFYIWTTTAMGCAVICVSLPSVFQAREYRVLRALVFVSLGCWGIVPLCHMTWNYWGVYAIRKALLLDGLMGATYLVGAAVFASRIPERWLPGKVDMWGHSHQLWHCAVVLAAYIHYHAVLVLLEWRDAAGGCAAAGLVNGPVQELLQQMRAQGVEMPGIEGLRRHLGAQLHKWVLAGAAGTAVTGPLLG